MKNLDPWYKATYLLQVPGVELKMDVPHDVFSTLRIDEGTLLLLEHLPSAPPMRVLDMGCGYGALGLPIAALYSDAKLDLVDRDLLAAQWSSRNAKKNQLSNVLCFGSLGFRDVPNDVGYDWVLCNVPARIGKPFIQNILEEGRARLRVGGELRIVVILDLIPVLDEIAQEHSIPLQKVAVGGKHAIFALAADPAASAPSANPDLYLRDQVKVDGLLLDRPFDLGGDDQKRLSASLPLLLDTLPRQDAPDRVLCVRSGYGAVPLVCKNRWPEAQITAFDRDLLALDFTRRNDQRINGEDTLQVLASSSLMDALMDQELFDLVTIELSSSAGSAVAEAELSIIQKHLRPGGRAIVVSLDKLAKEWVRPMVVRCGFPMHAIASRAGFTAFRLDG